MFATLLILYAFNIISNLNLISSFYAGFINIINSILAIVVFNKSYKSGNQKFMIYTLGGMGLRLLLLLVLFFLAIKFLNIDYYGFILVFFLFYFISLVLEVLFYLKKAKN